MPFSPAAAGKHLRRLAVGAVLMLLALVVLTMLASWAWWLPEPSASARSSGTNALWLRHSWVGEPHRVADYSGLAHVLHDNQISDAFFHVGPLDGDGGIPPSRYAYAPTLLDALHRSVPGLHVQAYVGQLLASVGGPLDLHGAGTRDRILATAQKLLDLGFDGIHYDIEPVAPSDQDFIDLLRRTHELTKERGAVLSVSIQRLEPWIGSQQAAASLFSHVDSSQPFTTRTYLRQVADQVDQVAVMVYGTPLPTAPLIGWLYALETEQVLHSIGDEVTVFIGVPTYEEGLHPTGEDLHSAIRGARRGLSQIQRSPSRSYGLGVFAEWTTSRREWAVWQQHWLNPRS
jgi:hypothetical protein